MEKLTLTEVVDELEVQEHNGRVRTLAHYYRATESEIERLYERITDLQIIQDEILAAAEADFITADDVDQFRGRIPITSTQIEGGAITGNSISVGSVRLGSW